MYAHQMLLLGGGGGGARAIEEAACHMFECTLTRYCATT